MSRSRLMAVGLSAVMLAALGSHTPAFSRPSNTEVTILSTGSVQGELAPCG